jgi:DNA polymerase-1
MMVGMSARLFLIDSFGFIFRAYHARARSGAPPMRTSTGISTEAIFIFHNMLRKLSTTYHPEYIAAIFESSGPTFRDQAFAGYKANRTEMPPDLGDQIPYIRRTLEALRIPILQYPGFEADDVIGAIARRAEAVGMEVVIVSSDKDMLQLVTPTVSMLNPMKDDTWYDPAKVQEFMGVLPEQVADLLALKGDSIDNIPGAPGIGDKGARDLIVQFGSVEAALDRAAEVQRKMYRESLVAHREQILLSKQLATIDTTVPIDWSLEAVTAQPPDTNSLKQVYKELEFFSFLKELTVEEELAAPRDYQRLETAEAIGEYLAAIPSDAPTAVSFVRGEQHELDGMNEAQFGIAWREGEGRSFGVEHLGAFRPFLEDDRREKIAHDVKSLIQKLCREGVRPLGFRQDVMLFAFLLSADPSGCACDTLAEKFLDRKLGTAPEQQADCALALAKKLGTQVTVSGLRNLYDTIDLPLVDVLTEMERTGIRIDPAQLSKLGARMDTDIQRLASEICAIAGRQFNINSPQQLGKVLFEELKLPAPVKYGKGKTISTAADVLETLAEQHEIARKVLEYRQLTKLKGTYVDALPALIDRSTGRLHTTFNQAGAATGRLSSSNPNLQNIPIRTELSREIRAAFVPREGWRMVVADYSQIELRLLAHMSKDRLLVEAFRNGEDIHTRTAAEVFGVPPLMVTPEMRRNAKAVNFGIVYGQTPFGLAAQLGIPRGEAEKYIWNYFDRYSGVKRFIERTVEEVRKTGAAKTMHGRQRPIPDMHSRNPNARSFAERTAVNTPLQGTAADLIKLAMIRIQKLLEGRQAKMLLQVHDELVFEAPSEEVEEIARMVKREMESVTALEVPLLVDVGTGPNWRDAK